MSSRLRTGLIITLLVAGCAGDEPDLGSQDEAIRAARAPLTVERSSATGFVVRFRPAVTETQLALGGKDYDALMVPGSALPALAGTPAVPVISRPFVLPEGATATATVLSARTRTRNNRWLRPTPPRWEDNLDAPSPPVTERPEDYGSAGSFPAAPVTVVTDGVADLAGLHSGVLQLPVARFTPSLRRLELVEELIVEVTFSQPFESRPRARRAGDQRYAQHEFINDDVIDHQGVPVAFPCTELLIVTSDALKPAADRLAVWKRQKGITTQVASTAIIGTTRPAINAYIQSRYDAVGSCLAYVLLLGDVETIPTYYPDNSDGDDTVASDLPYFKLDGNGNDPHADVAYGRISADTLTAADLIVGKILDYEQTPSRDASVYDAMGFAGYFQDDQSYASVNVEGVLLTSDAYGGNDLSLTVNEPLRTPQGFVADQPLEVDVSGTVITVTLSTDANASLDTTWRELADAINANPQAAALLTATIQTDPDGDGTDDHDVDLLAFEYATTGLSGGQAQDGVADRPYVDVLEEIRDVMLGNGKTIDRLYTTNSTFVDGPTTFDDGSALPADLLVSSGFAWDAVDTDIVTAWNAGRSIMWHRDHGGASGWSKPAFDVNDVGLLTNGDVDPASSLEDRYPVVFSINCLTGRFDQETDPDVSTPAESFAEVALRQLGGGGVAVIAASRVSSTSRNQYVAQGLFDAYWNNVVIGFNRTIAGAPTTFRLGDALIYAKDWLLTNYPDPSDAYTIDQVEIYHLHGDPTLEVWTEAPRLFGAIRQDWILVGGVPVLRVELTSQLGTPHLALWQGDVEASRAQLVSETVKRSGVTRVYHLPRPAAGAATSLYVSQPGYETAIRTVALP